MKACASLPGIISHRNSIFGAVQNDSVIFMRMYDRIHEYMREHCNATHSLTSPLANRKKEN